MNKKVIVVTSVITAVISVILTSVFYFSSAGMHLVGMNVTSPVASNYGKLLKIEKYINKNYMGSYNSDSLMDVAIHAYVDSLKDPYSGYFNKKEFESLNQQLDGEYRGIGVSVANKDQRILITEVKPESPAEKAGIQKGDVILKVDGTSYSGAQLSDAVNTIKGTALGESVLITVDRGGRIIDITVKIEKVIQELVKSKMLQDGIGYIYISTFGTSVAKDFSEALDSLKKQNLKGLVIDLRNNPGGTLDSAVEIADVLLPECTVVTVKDRHGNEDTYSSDKSELGIPLCVVINENSASASEVLSGALSDQGKAVLVGKKTFGKGVVQSVVDLGDGTGLSLTIAKYYTPSGVCINGIGISPDIEVDPIEGIAINPGEENENDVQLKTAVDILKQKIDG